MTKRSLALAILWILLATALRAAEPRGAQAEISAPTLDAQATRTAIATATAASTTIGSRTPRATAPAWSR